MDLRAAISGYALALGRWQAAWRFASPDLRSAVALGQIVAAWTVFRRDAGPGDVGPACEMSVAATELLTTADPRRDGLLLWLGDEGTPAIAEAASMLARATGASRRFRSDDRTLLEGAIDALAKPRSDKRPIQRALLDGRPLDDPVLEGLCYVAGAVDTLRLRGDFLEDPGHDVSHDIPGGTFTHFVAAAPGAAWSLNLALLKRGGALGGGLPCPGLVSRQLFRKFEPPEIAHVLAQGAALALTAGYRLFEQTEEALRRGQAALARKSTNSRTRAAWPLLVAVGAITRTQLARSLDLSRAGADVLAHALEDAGLAVLGPNGRIGLDKAPPLDSSAFGRRPRTGVSATVAEFDASMLEIDRLLARRSSPG